MQSYFQYRRLYKQLERQIVVKREDSEHIWTHERRYWYRNETIDSEPRDPNNGAPAERRRTHGHHTAIGGPAFEPRHTTRSHLERDRDVERADLDPEVQVDPYTINTRDSVGATVDMMVTGVERQTAADERSNGASDGVAHRRHRRSSSVHDKVIMIGYEGDCDPVDPHNWPFHRKLLYTTIVSLLGAVALWSTTIDATALVSTRAVYHTSFELQTVPTCTWSHLRF